METKSKVSRSKQLIWRTASGAGLLIGTRLATRLIDLTSLALLARLLTPADFGLVAIAMTIVLICEAVSDLPVAQAVVRLPTITQDHLDTAFTLSAFRGLTIAALLCIAAWPIAIVYRDPRLFGLICALCVAPALRGLCNPGFAIFARELDFRREMLVEVAAKIIALTVAATLAVITRSYWAIAAGTIAAPLSMVLLAYLIAPWRPRLTLREWSSLSRFLSWSSLGQVLNAISWQVDQLALGRFVPRDSLGNFAIASTLAFLPFQVVINQVTRPLVSALATLQHDPARLAAAYRLGAATLVAVCLPVIVGLSVLSEPIVALALGPKWGQAADVLRWLALATIPSLFVAPVGALAMAINRTDLNFRLSTAEFVVRLPLTCIAAAQAGVPGVLVARAAATLITSGYAMLLVTRMTGIGVGSQIVASRRAILSSAIMAAAIASLMHAFPQATSSPDLSLQLATTALAGALVYSGTTFLLWLASGRQPGLEQRIVALASPLCRRLIRRFGAVGRDAADYL